MLRTQLAALVMSCGLLAAFNAACGSNSTSPSTATTTTTTTSIPTSAAVVTLSATTLTFPIDAAAGSSQTITLTNTGTGPLGISSMAATGNFTETTDCGTTLAEGIACSITVTFEPLVVGASGTLTIADDAPSNPHTVTLTGPNVVGPGGVVSPSSLSFGSQAVGATSPAQTVRLTNPLNGASLPLSISSSAISGDSFNIEQNGCHGALAPGATCAVTISFTPRAPGSRFEVLSIFDNAPAGAQVVSLSGVGQ